MHSFFALAAPLALIAPLLADREPLIQYGSAPSADPRMSAPQCGAAGLDDPAPVNPLAAYRSSATVRQVRIEQRVVVRIAPQPSASRNDLLAALPRRESTLRFEERDKAKCVALQSIAFVETGSGNRLVLILRNREMISVNLEKSCLARDFYSGFYVEKNRDGRICVNRDRLQSRTGASCEVEGMRQLVAVRG